MQGWNRRLEAVDWTPWMIIGLAAALRILLLGIKPPRSAVGPMPKGRGLLVLRGSYLPVQVPLPDA